ncbi:MAG: hypothetical protein HY518_03410 [Candidatus Aenigmarchaeota archaeon]|nr:hypothetical protein [Candidatus Aenigmarchaeota archaeon]
MRMKGGFELSLNFVVIVVVAVILLTLSITFLTGIFDQFQPLTFQVGQIARKELVERLAGGEKVGVAAPTIDPWKRGQSGAYVLGLKNDDPARDKKFYINIYLENRVDGQDLREEDLNRWFSYTKASEERFELLRAGETKTSDLIIRPPSSTVPGIYRFRVLVCSVAATAKLDRGDCTTVEGTDTNLQYGDDVFSLEIQ